LGLRWEETVTNRVFRSKSGTNEGAGSAGVSNVQ
jgi:hypothetical protein